MIWQETAPWARVITLVVLGAAGIYALGRWDSRLNARESDLERDSKIALQQTQFTHRLLDSLRTIEDSLGKVDHSLARQAAATRQALRQLELLDSATVALVASSPLDSLLRPLRLRPVRLGGDSIRYITDSIGVRFLANRVLRLPIIQASADTLRSLVATQRNRITALVFRFQTAQLRADSAETQLTINTALLERHLKSRRCRIMWVLSCPSRITSLVLGVGIGLVFTLVRN